MINYEDFCLDTPPIKEVSMALFINSDSYNTEFINKFKEKIKVDYPEESSSMDFIVDINKNNQFAITDSNSSGYILENKKAAEYWNIDLQKIFFSDKGEYTNFKDYLIKFNKYFSIIRNEFNDNFSYSRIALKYSNEFEFEIEKLQEHFAILPLFQQDYKDITYAANTSCVVINNIVSNQNKNLSANVIAIFRVFEQIPTKFRINFDIDVRYILDAQKSFNENSFEKQIKEIRNFKNMIFFANVKKAKEDFKRC